MQRARYEQIEDGTFYGEIPGFEGVYANAETLDATRGQLQEVLEGWLLSSFDRRLPVPGVRA